MAKSVSPEAGGAALQWGRSIAAACLAGTAVTMAVLLLCAAVMASADVPQGAVFPMSAAAVMLGCFSAGWVCSRLTRRCGMALGAVCGLLLFGLLVLSDFAVLGGVFGTQSVYKLAVCLASSMIGGVVGVNQRRKIR